MFYLKPGCSIEELMSAHQTMVKRNSNNLSKVEALNQAFEIIKRDISGSRAQKSKAHYSAKSSSYSGGIDKMVNTLVEKSMKNIDFQNLKVIFSKFFAYSQQIL